MFEEEPQLRQSAVVTIVEVWDCLCQSAEWDCLEWRLGELCGYVVIQLGFVEL